MFEDYLQDAHEFIHIAEGAAAKGNDREAKRYYRAAIFYLAGALESFVNYIADSFAKAQSLTPYEIAFLNDHVLVFSSDKGILIERIEYHKIDDKLRRLIRKFSPRFDLKDKSWVWLMQFKDLRDSLIHPRQIDDEIALAEYKKSIHCGMTGIIEVMNVLSKGVFKKPLRKRILDLIPD
jgi:hypothetical protein